MNNTNNQLSEAMLATTAMIATNICNQIVAFQNAIASREEGNRFPTMQEVNLLCKLINCLEKLKRFTKQTTATQAITGFMRFLSSGDKELGTIVRTKFKEYTAQTGSDSNPFEMGIDLIPEKQEAATEPEHIPTQNVEETTSFITPSMLRDPSKPLPASAKAPFSETDFANYGHLLQRFSAKPIDKTRINDRLYDLHWIQYNLFQYHLPPANRRFYADEHSYHRFFNHKEVIVSIRKTITDMELRELR